MEEQQEALLRGEAHFTTAGPDGELAPPPPPLSSLSLSENVGRKPLPHARPAAAAAMQFDLIFSTTKYVIPLVALVFTGQAFNGLWSSMFTAQALHKVPAMRPELHHVFMIAAGALHTLLCASKSQVAPSKALGRAAPPIVPRDGLRRRVCSRGDARIAPLKTAPTEPPQTAVPDATFG